MANFFISKTAIVEDDVSIGDGTSIWHFVQVCSGAKIGKDCVIGKDVYIGKGAIIGNDVHIENGVSIYPGMIIKDRVFIGNNATFTNVRRPKVNKEGRILDTIIEDDVYIGAGAHIVAGVKIGKFAHIAEGATVLHNVSEGEMVAGPVAHSKKIIKTI